MEPLRIEFQVACSPERAFEVWTSEISRWWPKGHSVSADPGLTVTLEPGVGGRIFERTPDGTEHEWGEVLDVGAAAAAGLPVAPALRPRRRHRGGDHLHRRGRGDHVTIVHSGWERLGAVGPERRERNERGWAGLLPHYRDAVGA